MDSTKRVLASLLSIRNNSSVTRAARTSHFLANVAFLGFSFFMAPRAHTEEADIAA